jgi:hypothetical protein
MKLLVWPLCAALLGMVGCSGKPEFGITNRSSRRLTNIVVSGVGFSESINSLASGVKSNFTAQPTSGSRLRVSFDAEDKHIEAIPQEYVSNGSFCVEILIGADLTVSVSSALRP